MMRDNYPSFEGQIFNLPELLVRELSAKGIGTPALWFSPNLSIVNATYDTLSTPPGAVMRRIGTYLMGQAPELITTTDTTAAGTSVTLTLQSPVTSTTASRSGLELQRIGAAYVELGFNEAPAGQGQVVVTWVDADGVTQANTILFRYPTSGVSGAVAKMMLLPGRIIRGQYLYDFATVAPAEPLGTVAIARTATFAFTGLPNNTQCSATAINSNHQDALTIESMLARADLEALRASSNALRGCGS